jgi:hypothetical protein
MPELRIVGGPRNQEGAGNAGRSIAPMAGLQTKKQAAVTTGTPKRSGIPCTTVFRLIRAPPVTGLCCHRRFAVISRNLIPASGDRDHTISPVASMPLVQRHQHAHRIPRPTLVTIA